MTSDQDNINEAYDSGQSVGAGCARSLLLILLPALAAAIVIPIAVALASLDEAKYWQPSFAQANGATNGPPASADTPCSAKATKSYGNTPNRPI
jgi:hypothetical protein